MLGAFNEATPDWLSFFMFTFFTDRDGKMQLESLAQSGFDPLSRTCRFMLTEEAHHMFVGETGVGRTIQRTCEAMKEAGIEDPGEIDKVRALGVVDLPTLQKKMNLHYSLSLDLFGSEVSTNAANFYNAGLKGRFHETKIADDHRLTSGTYPVAKFIDGAIKLVDEPALTALNMRLARQLHRRLRQGRRALEQDHREDGCQFPPRVAAHGFHRQIGEFKNVKANPKGELLSDAQWEKERDAYLPSAADGAFIESLMKAADAAEPLRLLDRPAEGRHRQQARRFRICED